MKHKSDSRKQQSAEPVMRRRLNAQERISVVPESILLSNGATIKIDGVDRRARVLCEIYAHVGRTKGAQPGKIAKDILKLMAADNEIGPGFRKLICFCDPDTASCLLGKPWLAGIAADLGIEPIVVRLSSKQRTGLLAARRRQFMTNR